LLYEYYIYISLFFIVTFNKHFYDELFFQLLFSMATYYVYGCTMQTGMVWGDLNYLATGHALWVLLQSFNLTNFVHYVITLLNLVHFLFHIASGKNLMKHSQN